MEVVTDVINTFFLSFSFPLKSIEKTKKFSNKGKQ
jgi:hypothetical protein